MPSTGPGRDVVYSFTAPSAGKYSVRWVSDALIPALRSQDATLYAASNCPTSGTVSCLAGANRMSPASGQNKSEELYCMSLAADQTIYVYFDLHTAVDGGGVFDIEVTRCDQEVEDQRDARQGNDPRHLRRRRHVQRAGRRRLHQPGHAPGRVARLRRHGQRALQ